MIIILFIYLFIAILNTELTAVEIYLRHHRIVLVIFITGTYFELQ